MASTGQTIGLILALGGSGTKGEFIGYVTKGGSFPTTKPDGSALKDFDYVHPDEASEFPFTIDGVTFNTKNDLGYYEKNKWYLGAGGAGISVAEAKQYANQAGNYATQAGNKAVEAVNAADRAEAVCWKGTQAEYNALTSINPNTIYFIVG